MWEYNYDYLCHHGILNQKWGVRRFQNYDGSLTPEGKVRYRNDSSNNVSDFKNTVTKMREYKHYLHESEGKFDQDKLESMLKDVVKTKAMQKFFKDKGVEKAYLKRNEYLDKNIQFDENLDEFGPTTTLGAGIVFEKEITEAINKYFGEYANKSYSETNKNTNAVLMKSIIEEIDMLDNGKNDSVSPYPNSHAWLHWH